MTLVIFDIDGTLTQTDQADSDCFVRALEEVVGLLEINTDWSSYKHTTDSSILQEVYEGFHNRAPNPRETECFRGRFIELLETAGAQRGFAAIEGARHMLECLSRDSRYGVALATGAWSAPARLKMAGAG